MATRKAINAAFDATVLAAEQGTPPAITHFFEAATQEARDAVNPDGEPLFKSVEEAIAGREEINGVPVVLEVSDTMWSPSGHQFGWCPPRPTGSPSFGRAD